MFRVWKKSWRRWPGRVLDVFWWFHACTGGALTGGDPIWCRSTCGTWSWTGCGSASSTSSEAAASCKSSGNDAPLPRKQLQQHGIKNKRDKKRKITEHCPCTHDKREALKKPGAAPTMFAYLSLPPGRPKKKTSDATENVELTRNGTRRHHTREQNKWWWPAS